MRKANRNPPSHPVTVFTFAPHEFRWLKHNEPGPSGQLGGWPRLENSVQKHTDRDTLLCALPAPLFGRLISYLRKDTGPGGPNGRLRNACIPALRRIGIELRPEWRTPP